MRTAINKFAGPLILLVLPAVLAVDTAQIRLLLLVTSIMVGAVWAFAIVLSGKLGYGLLPEFDLAKLLKEAGSSSTGASIVVAAFFALMASFMLAIAYMVR